MAGGGNGVPPPEIWLRDEKPRYSDDPEEARKQRARRGRKRIDWKETRRVKQRDAGDAAADAGDVGDDDD